MSRVFCAAAAAALFVAGTATFAQAPAEVQVQAPAVAQSEGNETSVGNPDERVCVKQEVTGTRLGVKRVCKTRRQWAEQRLQQRQELERIQTQRGFTE